MSTFIFAGGGSAGHAIPSIRVAEAMRKMGHNVVFIGSKESIEERLCQNQNITYQAITTGKLDRSKKLSIFNAVINNIRGILEARKFLKGVKPSGVFSTGGYTSFPVVLAAFSVGVKTVIAHACDRSLGLANRLCLPVVTHVTCTFEDTCKFSKKSAFVGPIIDPKLSQNPSAPNVYKSNKTLLLVYGGSLGSAAINQKLRLSLPELLPFFDIIHVCGRGNIDETLNTVLGYTQYEFITSFHEVLQASDLAICRAGSGSLWELILTRTPHLAVPLPLSVSRGDQIENCKYFESLGVTQWMDQDKFMSTSLMPILQALLDDQDAIKTSMQHISPIRPASESICHILLS
jgi:UDP-N-acetylglucosamine--N-acetylmuramyl-(pentapeptide) pyrophosphoryl-undecaprenol N-acetylglucosamine transferase